MCLSSARSSLISRPSGARASGRVTRLTAIRSFFRFASFEEPAHSALIQRVLAIPSKRHDKRQVHFLTRPEIETILAAPDRTTWLGRHDHTLLLLTTLPARPPMPLRAPATRSLGDAVFAHCATPRSARSAGCSRPPPPEQALQPADPAVPPSPGMELVRMDVVPPCTSFATAPLAKLSSTTRSFSVVVQRRRRSGPERTVTVISFAH
jgi:hypothetical protein